MFREGTGSFQHRPIATATVVGRRTLNKIIKTQRAAFTAMLTLGAAYEPLLGEIHIHTILYLDVALQRSNHGKCPTTSATALVLDRGTTIHIPPVKAGRQLQVFG